MNVARMEMPGNAKKPTAHFDSFFTSLFRRLFLLQKEDELFLMSFRVSKT